MKGILKRLAAFAASLDVTLAAIGGLFLLVVLCTLDQVQLGTFGAVEKYFRAFFLWAELPYAGWRVPVFPAGGFVGLVLLVNTGASACLRLPRRRDKLGIWMIHIGLVLLILGEFATGAFQVEMQMAIDEGSEKNYVVSPRESELYLVDRTSAGTDEVFAVREPALRAGRTFSHEAWPFTLTIAGYFPNAELGARPRSEVLPPSRADRGIGTVTVVQPLLETTRDDLRDVPAAFVSLAGKDGTRLGTWLVSSAIDGGQEVSHMGRSYALGMRWAREYLPFTLSLKDFRHDLYAGTEIPKNFSSLVRLRHPEKGEDRDVLIYMNHPLRYMGKTFFQSSFGKGDTMSVFQVVENPGWLLPYAAFVLMGLGLILHFLSSLSRFAPRGPEAS